MSVVHSCLAGTLIANSTAEFSGVQGQNNWFYGYYDGDSAAPYTPADFELLNHYTPGGWGKWNLNDEALSYWTEIKVDHMHPNGLTTSGGRLPAEHWVTRRWVSEVTGLINLTGHIERIQPTAGNGTVAHIFVNNAEVYSYYVGTSDFEGTDYDITVQITQGSTVDYVVSPGSTDWADGTFYTSLITVVPEPAAIGLIALASGGIWFVRRFFMI
jgi:hypothetical protein